MTIECGWRRRGSLPSLLAFLVALVASSPSYAANRAPAGANRVVDSVDTGQLAVLENHRPAWASAKSSATPLAAESALNGLSITLRRSPDRQRAFDQQLLAQRDPASPEYQHWLSADEIGARFGVSQHDIDAVSAWLASQGLAVGAVSNSRMRIHFAGSAGAVERAFATGLAVFPVGPGKRAAPTQDPQVPAALATVIASVDGLSSVQYRAQHRLREALSTLGPAGLSQPAASSCQGGTCQYAVFPADFAKIYNLAPVLAGGVTGAGQTIGIIGRARVADADMRNFQQLLSLPVVYPATVIPTHGADPGPAATTCSPTGTPSCDHPSDLVNDQIEATLDVQRAGSVAPGATVKLIVSANVGSSDGVQIATEYAIDTNPPPAKVLSISYASCEADNSLAVADYLDGLFAQAAMEGISVFVASGDGGVAGCAALDSPPTANERVSTNVLCASGNVTCVGGTEFTGEPASQYWSPSNQSGYLSARGYIPEGAWNDPLDAAGHTQVASTGGGASIYIGKPSWQSAPGVPAAAARYTPDVSFNASPNEGYFTCVAAGQQNSCVVSNGSFGFILGGGTSASAPSMAGIAALLNQHTGSAQGNVNPRLYALANAGTAGIFHDVTVQSSGVANCSVTTPSLCNNSLASPTSLAGGLPGYSVGTGYDLATGLGSLDVAGLFSQWNSAGTTVNLNQEGLSGSWGNSATQSQGVVMTVYQDNIAAGHGTLFGGWFTFDVTAAGGRRWYTIQGDVTTAAASATIPIYATVGGAFDSPLATTSTAVGHVTLSFSDCTHGSMAYVFTDGSGRTGTAPLSRLLPNVACTPAGDTAAIRSDFLLSGAWADPAHTSGQGLVIEVNPTQHALFAAWYTFAAGIPVSAAAGQRWYTLQGGFPTEIGSLGSVAIYETSGGAFGTNSATSTTQVGTAELTFQDCQTASLVYRFSGGANAGQSGTLDLTRIGPAPAACSL